LSLDLAGTRNGPPEGTVSRPGFIKPLPAIEAMAPSALTPANGESDEPKNEKDSSRNPQKVYRKSSSKKDQDK
jgi:hypothetical protein